MLLSYFLLRLPASSTSPTPTPKWLSFHHSLASLSPHLPAPPFPIDLFQSELLGRLGELRIFISELRYSHCDSFSEPELSSYGFHNSFKRKQQPFNGPHGQSADEAQCVRCIKHVSTLLLTFTMSTNLHDRRMSLAPLVQNVTMKTTDAAMLIASKDGDFGGYTGPIIGLLIIGIIIAVLTPPVKE